MPPQTAHTKVCSSSQTSQYRVVFSPTLSSRSSVTVATSHRSGQLPGLRLTAVCVPSVDSLPVSIHIRLYLPQEPFVPPGLEKMGKTPLGLQVLFYRRTPAGDHGVGDLSADALLERPDAG